MTEPTPRLELIKKYKQIKDDLIEAASFGRPVCPVLAGDLMALAEKLFIVGSTQDFINDLSKKQNQQSGSFNGVSGY